MISVRSRRSDMILKHWTNPSEEVGMDAPSDSSISSEYESSEDGFSDSGMSTEEELNESLANLPEPEEEAFRKADARYREQAEPFYKVRRKIGAAKHAVNEVREAVRQLRIERVRLRLRFEDHDRERNHRRTMPTRSIAAKEVGEAFGESFLNNMEAGITDIRKLLSKLDTECGDFQYSTPSRVSPRKRRYSTR